MLPQARLDAHPAAASAVAMSAHPPASGPVPLLAVNDLRVRFSSDAGATDAVDGVSFQLERGETLALVGESGSGKSVTALCVMRLLPRPAGRLASGRILFEGKDLALRSEAEMRQVRGTEIGMVFQEPMTSLNPVLTVGAQVSERLRVHAGLGRRQAARRAVEMLDRVRIPEPGRRAANYPHQMSGGMRQRVMIAMALACRPKLLIADEPTTALDVTIQAQILDLMRNLQAEFGMAILFITHDLGVVAEMADRVVVMYRGRAVEQAAVRSLFANPRVPYTQALLRSIPRIDLAAATRPALAGDPADYLLEVRHLRKHFTAQSRLPFGRASTVKAVDDVSFAIRAGEVLGLVGESGSGKTTVGRSVLRLLEPTSGQVLFEGVDITQVSAPEMRRRRKDMQIIFQDPYASLNPRMTVSAIIGQALDIHHLAVGRERAAKIVDLLERVGLSAAHLERYPHEFSGGQRQRIGIARALGVGPRFIIADEPVSALDVTIQAQVIDLLQDLQHEFRLALLFISHDLGVVECISDRVMVMYLGRVMEIAPSGELYRDPRHPYTQALLSAIPVPDPTIRRARLPLEGDIPSPRNPPSGCVFRTRCPAATADCAAVVPALEEVSPQHFKACINQ
jgi:oligopeptide/dipeptide ABC transporter ATP-binding protein